MADSPAASRSSSPGASEPGSARLPASSSYSSLSDLGRSLGLPSLSPSRHRLHRRSSSASVPASSAPPTPMAGSGSIQDRLFSRVLQQVLPSDYPLEDYADMRDKRKDTDRPGFSLTLMSNNFRRFNSRYRAAPALACT